MTWPEAAVLMASVWAVATVVIGFLLPPGEWSDWLRAALFGVAFAVVFLGLGVALGGVL